MTSRIHARHRPIQPWVGQAPCPAPRQLDLHYREFAAPDTLAELFVAVWTLTGPDHGNRVHRYHVVPDGCSDLIFDQQAGEGFIFGTVSKAKTVEMCGPVALIGLRLQPHLLPAFTGCPAAAVRDVEPSFREASLGELNQLFQWHVADTPDRFGASQAEALAHAVAARFRPERVNIRAKWLVSALLDSNGSVDHAARKTGFTSRQLQRIAQHDLGLSPKLMGRILRMQRSLPAVLDKNGNHAVIAAEHGYADQAHMIREFTTLTGYTPGFWQKRKMSDLFNPPEHGPNRIPA